ncbi:DUF4307 domain-containing protein [Corynebacterium sp. CNCTC7651]|uniref:DUF4307 domain-containing protein n=1 Tax=Corynebacterium sp. CNCTC7651 TaxID=2815361 RepID=UPI001F32E607|nr:DUF4307 domain-containing protein [Corynebacterium sp. CNCTC7651]
MSTSSPSPRSRYGSTAANTGSSVSGKVVAIFAVAMLALVVFMGIRAFTQAQSRPITAEFISQERVDDSTARLWIEVDRKDVEQDAYCIVFAVDYEHNEIGRREVVIPAGGEKLQRLAVELPTRSPVASGRIYGCSQQIPFYMDTGTTYLSAR